MKTTNRFLILMLVVLLSFSLYSCKTSSGNKASNNTHIITLYVDTDNINQQNRDSTYISNFGQPNHESNMDFSTDVELEDDIIWVGVSSSSPESDEVRIIKILHKKGKFILNKKELRGGEKVRGKVKNGSAGDVEFYSVLFTVFNNGTKRNGTFKIDPRLIVKSSN